MNNNQFYFSPLTERDFDNNFSKIENRNHYYQEIKLQLQLNYF